MEQGPVLDDETVGEIRAGLIAGRKRLPSRFLYDKLGSILFEAITVLPEYYLTHTERQILDENAGDIVGSLDEEAWLVELGAGSAVKTQILIERMLRDRRSMVYCPVDISAEALRTAEANIRSRFPSVSFRGVQGDWFQALEELSSMQTPQKLIAFLGSSIGNLEHGDAVDFFKGLAKRMAPEDRVLLGTDMVKPVEELIPAYDDAAGVTAAFNRNILVRLNRELDGDIDPRAFRHEARWDPQKKRVEMHLVARRTLSARLKRLELDIGFEQGESIHTESSHKFTPGLIDEISQAAGLGVLRCWADAGDRFRLNLLGRRS